MSLYDHHYSGLMGAPQLGSFLSFQCLKAVVRDKATLILPEHGPLTRPLPVLPVVCSHVCLPIAGLHLDF